VKFDNRWLGAGPLLLAVALPALALGQEPPAAGPDATFEERDEFASYEAPPAARLIELARQRSPRLAELSARIAAAEEKIAPAGALANPMVEARLENMSLDEWMVGDDEGSQIMFGASQALPYPGKREARRQVARAELGQALAERAAAERSLALEVERLVADLYAADRELELLDAVHELLQMLASTVAARYGVGEADQEAVLKIQLQISRHDQFREGVLQMRQQGEAELRRALALPAGTPIGRIRQLVAEALPPGDLAVRAPSEAPEVAVARAAVVVAERRLDLERLELRPDFSVNGGVMYRGDLDPGVVAGLGVELPLWRRRRQLPLIRAAESELAAARHAEQSAQLAALAEAEAQLAAWRRVERRLALSSEGILPQSSAALDAARSGYLTARSDFSTVVEDLSLWLEGRVEHARLEAERYATRAALAALVREDVAPAAEGGQP